MSINLLRQRHLDREADRIHREEADARVRAAGDARYVGRGGVPSSPKPGVGDYPSVPMPLLPLIRLARERGVDPLVAIAASHRPLGVVFAEEDARKENLCL